MDNKITKRRLKNVLSYDWVKMVVVVLGICLLWSLAFTIGAPRASTGQTFSVFYYGSFHYVHSPSELTEEIKNKNAFSYDVISFGSRVMDESYYGQLMSTTNAVQEGDIMITIDSSDKIESNRSEFRQVIDGYGDVFYDYETLIYDAKMYCLQNGFVQESEGIYSLNEQRIATHFASRMKKDPRFRDKNGERYAQGVRDEIQRIKNVWNNAIILEDCLKNHPEIAYKYTRFTQAISANPEEYTDERFHNQEEKIYGIHLGALTGGEFDANKEFVKVIYGENQQIVSSTAQGIVVLVYNYSFAQLDLQFETIAFVNQVIARYSNFLNLQASGIIA